MRTASLCAVLAVAAAALLTACGTGGQRVAATQQPPAALTAPQPPADTPTLTAPQPQAGTPTLTAPQPQAGTPTQASPPPSSGLDETEFWRLIDETRRAAGGNTGDQSDLLKERLKRLPARQIADFGRIRHALDVRAYTWDLWGAAFVIEDGCSDDCFRDFRSYVISLGRGPYETAVRSPDALAPIVQDRENGDWENADDVAPEAYKDVTDKDIPVGGSDLSGNPRGTPWDDNQEAQLIRRYPRLAARFR
jgi:hypothetical protein